MELDKEQFIQELEDWHDNHLDYYANYVERIRKDGHKGIAGIRNIMSELYPGADSQIHDGMNNPDNNLSSTIESVKKSGFVENMVDRFHKGDDQAAASLYFIVVGSGMIILFTIVYDLWHDKKLSLKSLGLSRLLLSRMCKRIVASSINSGFDTVEDWRESIDAIYEGQENKPDIEKYLVLFNEKQDTEANVSRGEDAETTLRDQDVENVCENQQDEQPVNQLNEESEKASVDIKEQRNSRTFADFIFCDQEKKEQIVNYVINELSRNNSGKYLACMKLALEELKLTEIGKLKPFHSALKKVANVVSYRQANRDYQQYAYLSSRSLELCTDDKEKEMKEIELAYCKEIIDILKRTDSN